jgi:hypothetical protein
MSSAIEFKRRACIDVFHREGGDSRQTILKIFLLADFVGISTKAREQRRYARDRV